MTLPCGMCVTHSDVHVLQPYETTSRHSSPLYMLVVLEGCVALTLNGEQHLVRSGMAFTSRLSEHQDARPPRCRQPAPYALPRTLPDGAWRDGLLDSLMREWERCQTPTLIWQIPGFLLSGLQYAQQSTLSRVSRQLMLEGLILQLFGHGLSVCQDESAKHVAPAGGEQQRLERVRRLLEQAPENDYTLNELAQRAAMSSSSLRSKFRQAYGCSVFDYLRDCRLGGQEAICWRDIACSRRPGCRVISTPPTSLPPFVGATASRPAMCKSGLIHFSLFAKNSQRLWQRAYVSWHCA
jgi:hypothetical protein